MKKKMGRVFEDKIEKIGEKIGFVFSYFLFTSVLFVIFGLIYKTAGFTYLHAMGITLLISIVGIVIRGVLK